MGNRNDVHVKMMETMPSIGLGVSIVHLVSGNIKEAGRAILMNLSANIFVKDTIKYLLYFWWSVWAICASSCKKQLIKYDQKNKSTDTLS